MKLFRYELNKLFSVRWFILLLTVFFGASVIIHLFYVNRSKIPDRFTNDEMRIINAFVHEYGLDDEKYTEYKNAVEQLKNSISEQINDECTKAYQEGKSEEEIRAIWTDQKRYETHIYSDALTDDVLQNEMAAYQTARNEYLATVGIITDQAKQNAETLRKDQGMGINDPLYQYQIYVYKTYDAVAKSAEVGVDTVKGWDKLLTYNYGDIFIFISLILFSVAVFLSENQNGMMPILRAAKKGRLPTALSKISVVIFGATAITLIYSLSSFIIVLMVQGYSDPSVSVQNVKAFAAFPYAFSILQYYLYGIMLKVVSASAFALVCGFLAALIRNQAFYYLSSAAFFGISFAFGKIPAAAHPMLHGLNLYSICSVVPVTERLYVFQPFLSCTSYCIVAPILCGGLIVLSGILTAVSFCCVRYAGRTRSKLFSAVSAKIKAAAKTGLETKKSKKKSYTSSVFLWECGKALTGNLPVLLLVIALFAAHVAVCVVGKVNTEPDREKRIFNKFVLSEVEGKFSDNGDKCGFLVDIFTLQQKDLYDQMFTDAQSTGIITAEESAGIRESLEFIDKNELNGNFGYAKAKYEKNLELSEKGYDADFINETGAEPIVTRGASYPLYAAILIVCTGLYMIEFGGKSKTENFANILRTSKNGRKKTFNAKLCAGICISVALSVIYNITEFTIFAMGRDLSYINVPMYSITAFADSRITLTVLQYIVLMYVLRIVIAVLFSVFVLAAASLMRNLPLAFGVVTGATLLPTLLYSAGLRGVGYISFCDFFGVNGMMLFSSTVNLFGGPLNVFILYGILFSAYSIVLTLVSRFRFTE